MRNTTVNQYGIIWGVIFIVCLNTTDAQIVYQSTDYAVPLDSFLMSEAPEAQLSGYNFDTTGANFLWVFDTLPAVTQKWRYEEDPDETGYKVSFLAGIPYVLPGCIESCIDAGGTLLSCTFDCNDKWDSLSNATLTWDTINLQAFQIYDIYNFYANTGTACEKRLFGYKVSVSGLESPLTTVFDSPDVLYRFPMAYGNSDSSESSFTIDLDLGFIYSHWQKRINEVDGWGSLTTPYKTYPNTIRHKSLIHSIDKFTITDTGEEIDLSTILPDSIIEYKWFDASYGNPILTVKAIVQNGIRIYVNAEYIDTLRCMVPLPVFGYLPVPTYLNVNTDSVEVNFYNLSVNYDSLIWNFDDPDSGDDSISFAKNPSHWYTSQGVYVVTLTVCNTSPVCSSLICTTLPLPVVVIDTSMVYANFVYSPLFPCAGDTVFFTNTSVNDTAWLWDFGDGFTDTAENPFHIYSTTGSYPVTLIAYKGAASDTIIKTVQITSTPLVDFSYSDTVTLVPVQFTDLSTGVDANTDYLWTFGGGKPDKPFSLDQNPVVIFEREDSVTVCLLAFNSLGCAGSACKKFYVTKCLEAKFLTSGVTNNYCINDNITCTNATTTGLGNPVNYSWYKDGVFHASTNNTVINFTTTGSYSIMLVADNGICTDTAVKTVNIKSPAALYSAGNDTNICLGDTIQLSPLYTAGGQAGVLFNWQPATGLSAVNIPAPLAFPDTTTEYIFTFQVLGGACDLAFSDKDTIVITVDSCLVTAPLGQMDPKVIIYPNPATGRTGISFIGLPAGIAFVISITDITGREIIHSRYQAENTKPVLIALDPGIYFYLIRRDNDMLWMGKFIVE